MSTHSVQLLSQEGILVQLRALMPMLTERYKVSQLDAFGAVAQNKTTEESDIDIVVHMEPDMFKRFHLKEELEARLGREVDVIRYRDSMNPYLKARIDRDVLYV